MSLARLACADAALALWASQRRVSQGWLMLAAPYYIRECAAKLRSQVYAEHPGYREQHGSRVIAAPGWSLDERRDSAVADAAQWLYLNRKMVTSDKLYRWSDSEILRTAKVCKKWDAQPDPWEDKKYSLSDLQRAYDLGFGTSGEAWNQEIHPNYLEKENYQAERLEALREFK